MLLLSNWNGKFDRESKQSLILSVWEQKFTDSLFQKQLGGLKRAQYLTKHNSFEHFLFRQLEKWGSNLTGNHQEAWCENKDNSHLTENNCIYNLISALKETYHFLCSKMGSDISQWEWGKLHKKRIKNIPFTYTPLKYLFDREFPDNGNRRTLDLSYYQGTDDSYDGDFSASSRIIISMDEQDKSYWILDTGVSENIFTKHYDDQYKKYRQGKYVEMICGRENLEKNSHYKLELNYRGGSEVKSLPPADSHDSEGL